MKRLSKKQILMLHTQLIQQTGVSRAESEITICWTPLSKRLSSPSAEKTCTPPCRQKPQDWAMA